MPTHIHVLVNLASAYRATGRFEEARRTLETALQVDPRFAIAHNNLGNVLTGSGRRPEALHCYQRAAALDPSYADPIAGLAGIAEEEHRLEDSGVWPYAHCSWRRRTFSPGSRSPASSFARTMLWGPRRSSRRCGAARRSRRPIVSSSLAASAMPTTNLRATTKRLAHLPKPMRSSTSNARRRLHAIADR